MIMLKKRKIRRSLTVDRPLLRSFKFEYDYEDEIFPFEVFCYYKPRSTPQLLF